MNNRPNLDFDDNEQNQTNSFQPPPETTNNAKITPFGQRNDRSFGAQPIRMQSEPQNVSNNCFYPPFTPTTGIKSISFVHISQNLFLYKKHLLFRRHFKMAII